MFDRAEGGRVRLVKRLHDEVVLASEPFDWQLDRKYRIELRVAGSDIEAHVDGKRLFSVQDTGWAAVDRRRGCARRRQRIDLGGGGGGNADLGRRHFRRDRHPVAEPLRDAAGAIAQGMCDRAVPAGIERALRTHRGDDQRDMAGMIEHRRGERVDAGEGDRRARGRGRACGPRRASRRPLPPFTGRFGL